MRRATGLAVGPSAAHFASVEESMRDARKGLRYLKTFSGALCVRVCVFFLKRGGCAVAWSEPPLAAFCP